MDIKKQLQDGHVQYILNFFYNIFGKFQFDISILFP